MKILILGATGLLGNMLFRVLSQSESSLVFGTTRQVHAGEYFSHPLASRLLIVNNLENPKEISDLLETLDPDVVINCTSYRGTKKQDLMKLFSIYSVTPRHLQHICLKRDIRLIHFSSDGVFSGAHGGYIEGDTPDAIDTYGIAKYLGEVEGPRTLTLRTSVFGPELIEKNGLFEWFLNQSGKCRGYTRAIFSGFPSVVLANIVRDVILPNDRLHGLYHLASQPISKFDLLDLIRLIYGIEIELIPDDSVVINRSLSAERFSLATGYIPPSWPELILTMREFNYGLKES
jgi:dTDP-4-dehydrorhamnose reductase